MCAVGPGNVLLWTRISPVTCLLCQKDPGRRAWTSLGEALSRPHGTLHHFATEYPSNEGHSTCLGCPQWGGGLKVKEEEEEEEEEERQEAQ